MQKNTLITSLLLISLSCTKHQSAPLSPRELLLTSSPWLLQRADSTFLSDDWRTITSTSSFTPSNCSLQPHYIFKTDHTVKGYLQCDPPDDLTGSWTWDLDSVRLSLSTPIPFHRGSTPPVLPSDTVITLTKDSLVIHQFIDADGPYENPLTIMGFSHPVRVVEHFSH